MEKKLIFYKENNSKRKLAHEFDHKRMKAILESLPCAVVIVDAEEWNLSYLNKRALELYGINYVGYDLNSHFDKVKALKLDGTAYPLMDGVFGAHLYLILYFYLV